MIMHARYLLYDYVDIYSIRAVLSVNVALSSVPPISFGDPYVDGPFLEE